MLKYLLIRSLTETSYLTVRNKQNLCAFGRSRSERVNLAPNLIGIILVVVCCVCFKLRRRCFMGIFKAENIEFAVNIKLLSVAHILLCSDLDFSLTALIGRLP